MTVTIDFARLDGARDTCLPQGRSHKDYELTEGGRDLLVIPGNTISFSMKVTAGDPVDVGDIAADGTIETKTVHGLKAGEPFHLCFYSGVAPSPLTPHLKVKEVIDSHHFRAEDERGNPVIIEKQEILGAKPEDQPKICGWVAKAANLRGFHGAIIFDTKVGRQSALTGTAAIKKGSNQIQIKGTHDIKQGDTVSIGDNFSGSAVLDGAHLNGPGGCYTIVQVDQTATEEIPFTRGLLAANCPLKCAIEGVGEGDAFGWVQATMPSGKTAQLEKLRKPTADGCPQYIGRFRFELRGGPVARWPSWMKKCPKGETTFNRIFDYGQIWI